MTMRATVAGLVAGVAITAAGCNTMRTVSLEELGAIRSLADAQVIANGTAA